ncbi:MAG TPA: hypothetical protein VF463_18860 [Sphingobium sp.]
MNAVGRVHGTKAALIHRRSTIVAHSPCDLIETFGRERLGPLNRAISVQAEAKLDRIALGITDIADSMGKRLTERWGRHDPFNFRRDDHGLCVGLTIERRHSIFGLLHDTFKVSQWVSYIAHSVDDVLAGAEARARLTASESFPNAGLAWPLPCRRPPCKAAHRFGNVGCECRNTHSRAALHLGHDRLRGSRWRRSAHAMVDVTALHGLHDTPIGRFLRPVGFGQRREAHDGTGDSGQPRDARDTSRSPQRRRGMMCRSA